jgi:cell division protein FtsB
MRLTLDDYSKKFKMSKEMINSRIKTKKIHCITEDGVKYIVVTDSLEEDTLPMQTEKNLPAKRANSKTTVATVISLYKKENLFLKNKVAQLEEKIDKLIDDKEQMLIDERDKIEDLYSKKDEQLKNILELINAKMQIEAEANTVHEVELYDNLIELKTHLKSLGINSHQRKLIKKRFLNIYDSDSRVIHKDGKLYLDFAKYDYGDLLKY